MSWTESDSFDMAAESMFVDALVPLAAGEAKAHRFPLGADPEAETYYQRPVRTSMAGADFDLPGGGGLDGFVAGVAELWGRQGRDDLVGLQERLDELAALVDRRSADEDAEVSPFIYPMF